MEGDQLMIVKYDSSQIQKANKPLGYFLAYKLLVKNPKDFHSCAFCGENNRYFEADFAICFGIPVSVCDLDCYERLIANWRDLTEKEKV